MTTPEAPIHYNNPEASAWQAGYERAAAEIRIAANLSILEARIKELERDKARLDWCLNGVVRLPTYSSDDGAFKEYKLLRNRDDVDTAMKDSQ
jgi:hypothetical protein